MKLSKPALQAIYEHSPAIKNQLALALNCSEGTINRYIRDNDDNLTKAAALKIIQELTGLTMEKILES